MDVDEPMSCDPDQEGTETIVLQREERRGSMQDRWEAAVLAAKASDARKLQEEKRKKLQQYLASIRSGLVRRRISSIEVLIMQQSASKDRIASTLKDYYKRRHEQTARCEESSVEKKEDVDKPEHDETLTETSIDIDAGTTIIVTVASSHPYFDALATGAASDALPLLCGIYGDGAHTSPVAITAVAIPPAKDATSIDIALSVEVIPGHEFDLQSYGYKKIALYLPSTADMEAREVYSGVLCIGAQNNLEEVPSDDCLTSDIDGNPVLLAANELDGTADVSLSDKAATSFSEPEISVHESPFSPSESKQITSTAPAVDDDMDPEAALELQLNLLREATPAAPRLPELTAAKHIPQTIATAYSLQCYDHTGKRPPWLAADERLPSSVHLGGEVTSVDANVELSTTWVEGVSSTRDALILRLKPSSESGAAMSTSIVVCAALKYQPSENYFVFPDEGVGRDDQSGIAPEIFEWSRAAAKSGWLIKWPMQSQNRFGRRTTRYFVLRDRFLSYYNTVPGSLTSSSSYTPDSAMHTIFLSRTHTVAISRHHMRSCVKVSFL